MIHRNQLGSTSMLTGPAGQEESDFVFFPYGDLWKAGPAYEYHFAGFDFHGGWGWYGTNARPYHWDLGSWLSPDPTGGDVTNPQSLNRYAYVLNNPATLNDPSGLQPPQGLLWQQRRRTCAMDPICMYMWGQDPFFGLDALITGEGYSGGENGDIPDWNPGIFNGAAMTSLGGGFIANGGRFYNPCSSALAAANRTRGGVARANADWNVLQATASAHNIPAPLLAAVGLKETDFRNIQELNGGPGMGVFQLTNQQGVPAAQAFNIPFAANYAANMLSSNMKYLSSAFSFTPNKLLQATAASYNFGTGNISGNPNTIDVGTTGGNYGSTVVNLMGCFSHP